MKIAFNPSTVAALIAPPNNKDITFDLRGQNIFARGVKFCGTDTWRPVVDNLTSYSTTSSLSANQGRILKALIDGKSDSNHNHDGRYVKKSGDTMLGALNFANGTWNLVGNDSYMGDCNISGHFGIKTANTTYPGIAFFNNANDHLGNLTAYNGNIKYGAYSLQFLDNGNTSVRASTWMNPFSGYNSNAVTDGQAICVWGQSSSLSNLAADSGDMSLWLKRVNAKVATLNMVLDGEYYANGNQRLAHVSEIPSSLRNPYALTISLNGTSQGSYDGSAAKNINITPSSIGAATNNHNHDGRYVRYYVVTTLDCNNLAPGLTVAKTSATNSAVVNNSAFLYISDVGTPFQLQIPDSDTPCIFKRIYSSGKWSGWFKLNAGYADSAGSVAWNNVTGKPSSYTPSAHTHTVFNNNLMIKGTNGISNSAYIHLGIGDSDTGFKWISDGKCQIYANNSAVGEWTSDGMNWFKNPTVNGNKVWNAGNDGSGSGLDADTLDGYHSSSLWRSDGATWNPGANVLLKASANNQEWSFDITRNGHTGCHWHVYDSARGTMLKVNADNGKVYALYNFVGNLEGNASTATALTTNAGNSINPVYFSGGKPIACTMSTGRGDGIVRSFSRGAYTSANQYFGNGTIVAIDPIGTGCISANDTILSLGDTSNRNTQLLVAWDRDGVYYRRIIDTTNYGSWKRLAFTTDNIDSATKLATARSIWGQSFNGTADVNGTIYINNSDSSNGAIRLNNNVNSNARISAISDQVIFNTGSAIRFGETAWDQNKWAGLKYNHSNKTIYLGIADNSIFSANNTQSGGALNLRAGISSIDLNSGTAIRGLPTNGSPYSSRVTLNDTSIYLSAYGDMSMSTGFGAIRLISGNSGVKLSCSGTNASINSEGFKVEASRGVYLNSGNSGNVYLCQGRGNVSIGYSSPSYTLDVNGQMRADGFHHYYANSNDYVLLAGGGYLIHKSGSTTWSTAIQFGNYVWIILQMDDATSGRRVVPSNIARPTKDIYVVNIQTGKYSNSRNGIYRIAPDGNLYHVGGPDGQRLYTTICYVAS